MADQVLMHILHSTDDLPEVKLGLFLCDLVVLNEVVQLSFRCNLHNHKNVIGSVKHFVQLDDIGVVDELQDLDLPLYFRYHVLVLHLLLVYDFHCHLDTGEIVLGLCDKSKRYILLWQTHLNQSFCRECSGQCGLLTC